MQEPGTGRDAAGDAMHRDISMEWEEEWDQQEMDRDTSPKELASRRKLQGVLRLEELISVPKGSLARGFHGSGSAATRPTGMCCHLRVLENDGKREQGERWKDTEHAAGVRRKGKAAVWPLLAPRGKIPGTLCMLEASAATAKKAHRMQINHCVRSTPEEHPARGARGKGADSLPSDRQR